jgi:hypothetical protein
VFCTDTGVQRCGVPPVHRCRPGGPDPRGNHHQPHQHHRCQWCHGHLLRHRHRHRRHLPVGQGGRGRLGCHGCLVRAAGNTSPQPLPVGAYFSSVLQREPLLAPPPPTPTTLCAASFLQVLHRRDGCPDRQHLHRHRCKPGVNRHDGPCNPHCDGDLGPHYHHPTSEHGGGSLLHCDLLGRRMVSAVMPGAVAPPAPCLTRLLPAPPFFFVPQVAASGSGLTYQWLKGGVAITGATAATYVRAHPAPIPRAHTHARSRAAPVASRRRGMWDAAQL